MPIKVTVSRCDGETGSSCASNRSVPGIKGPWRRPATAEHKRIKPLLEKECLWFPGEDYMETCKALEVKLGSDHYPNWSNTCHKLRTSPPEPLSITYTYVIDCGGGGGERFSIYNIYIENLSPPSPRFPHNQIHMSMYLMRVTKLRSHPASNWWGSPLSLPPLLPSPPFAYTHKSLYYQW